MLQAKYCGNEIMPPVIHSQFNKMLLKFYGKPGAEFKLKYKSGNLNQKANIIMNPNLCKFLYRLFL